MPDATSGATAGKAEPGLGRAGRKSVTNSTDAPAGPPPPPKGGRRVPREPLRQEVCTTKWPGGSGWNWVVHGQERMEFPGLEPRCSTHRNVFL